MTRFARLFGLVLALFLACAGNGGAQVTQEDRDYYQTWLKTAGRAERVIDAGRASNVSLERLRVEIVGYREGFAKTRAQNTDRIGTIASQLDALGPIPENGEEPDDIADLRKRLTDHMSVLRVPQIVSDEAHSRANGLILEIDRIIRNRTTKRLTSRGPSPLNPAYWPEALGDLKDAWGGLFSEVAQNWRSPLARKQISERLPLILSLTGMGLMLLLFGRRWSDKLGHFLRQFGGSGTGVWSFVVSLARVALPLFGMGLLVRAATLTGLLGVRGTLFAQEMPAWTFTILAFNWLAYQLYGGHRDTRLLPSPKNRRRELTIYIQLLALTMVMRSAIDLYGQVENLTDASRSVVAFPIITAAALLLLRLQRVGLETQDSAVSSDGSLPVGRGVQRIMWSIRRGALILALVSPVLAAIGYGVAAEAIVYPVIQSLVAISVVLILQRFFGDLYGWLWGQGDVAPADSLFSVLIGFGLAVLSVPVLALIWGARAADLTEIWATFLEGFQLGDTQISPAAFLTFAIVFVAGYSVTRLLQSGLRTNLLPKTTINPGGQNAIVAFTGYLGIFLAALIAVSAAGLDLSSVAIVAGALSVGIGFGLQTIVSNFVSGIILLIERPISKGDWIEVSGFAGYVRDISVRSTRIETFDRADVIVPNSDLIAGTVTNYTRGKTIGRVKVPVGVAYGSDTREVETILSEIANAHPMVVSNPPPNVIFHGFGADSLDFEIRAILRDVNWVLAVKSDMNHEIARRFTEADIEIPFAQRDVWLRNPEVLGPQPAVAAAEPGARADPTDRSEPPEPDKEAPA